jgi:hypothetical protein
MHAKRTILAVPALAMALATLLPAAAVAADAKPNLSGTWLFARQKSDDVRQKVSASVGSDSTVGSEKSEQTRVWIRTWLQGFAEDSAKRVLTIEQTAT